MIIQNYRGCIAATSLLLAICTAPVAFAQDDAARERQQDANRQGMEKIAQTYESFQQATLQALEEKARSWQDKKSDETAGGAATDPNRSGQNTGSIAGSAMQLQKDELLIAACSDGLLAGAPTADLGRSTMDPRMTDRNEQDRERRDATGQDPNASGQDPNRDATGRNSGTAVGQMGGERAVGLILVCSHDAKSGGGAGAQEASGARSATGAMGSTGKLEPGAYCVKLAGSTVTLVDKDGKTVLRTTLDSKSHGASATDPNRRTGGVQGQDERAGRVSGEQPGTDRSVAGGTTGMHGNQDWEHVFGAVTKEVMTSMGWSKRPATGSMR